MQYCVILCFPFKGLSRFLHKTLQLAKASNFPCQVHATFLSSLRYIFNFNVSFLCLNPFTLIGIYPLAIFLFTWLLHSARRYPTYCLMPHQEASCIFPVYLLTALIGILIGVTTVVNLMKRHPNCKVLIHRPHPPLGSVGGMGKSSLKILLQKEPQKWMVILLMQTLMIQKPAVHWKAASGNYRYYI